MRLLAKHQLAGSAEDLDITHQMEAFLHVLYDNNISKWKKSVLLLADLNKGTRQFAQIKVVDSKEWAEELNNEERKADAHWCSSEEHAELKTPHTKTHAGQNMFGGWENNALKLCGELSRDAKLVCDSDQCEAWEKDLLAKVRALLGLDDEVAPPRKKKVKKDVPPPADDTPTKAGFDLAFG